KRFVDGELVGAGVVPATFWRDHLALHVVESRAEVRPLRALQPGEDRYTGSSEDVRRLWPHFPALSANQCRCTQVARRRGLSSIPPTITEFSRDLAGQMAEVGRAGGVSHALKPRTIENRLRELELWP